MPRSFTARDLGEVAGITAGASVKFGSAPLVDLIIRMRAAGRVTDEEIQELRDILNNSAARVRAAVAEKVRPILRRPDPPDPSVEEIMERATEEFRRLLGQAVDAIAIEQDRRPLGELPPGDPEQDDK